MAAKEEELLLALARVSVLSLDHHTSQTTMIAMNSNSGTLMQLPLIVLTHFCAA